MKRRAPLALLLGAAVALPPALAADATRRGVVEQKAALVQRMLSDPAVVQRVRDGSNEEAKRLLSAATDRYMKSVELARDGNMEASESAINEAMSLMARARQMVPDPGRRASEQKARHAQLLESTQGMLASATRHLSEGVVAAPDAARARGDIARAGELMASADKLVSAGRFDAAISVLAAAEQALLSALAGTLGAATLDYTPRFGSPVEEYRHEFARFSSFRQLVPRAIRELKPDQAASRQVDMHVEQGMRLRDEAEHLQGSGDIGAALRVIREATDSIRRALAAAGLEVQTQ